ncbi:MAG TPA: protein tyrosine phosphatase, partial [Isosphaeraceae bacterium]|nr:protein tyrosine phosphatase [Isosphaeraceae bacterium]
MIPGEWPRAWWKTRLRRFWPWLVLVLAVIPAVWHVVDFEEDVDPEFPKVERPTFSAVPPSAYRLAEPGDTLDRVELYLASASLMLAAGGLVLGRGGGLWPAAMALALAGYWYSATPGPTVDGWHGLGWRTIADAGAPPALRAALLAAAIVLAGVVAVTVFRQRARFGHYRGHARARGTTELWVAAVMLVLARQIEIPGVEPSGYWPRWAMIWGLLAFDLGLLIELIPGPHSRLSRWSLGILTPLGWLALVVLGIDLTWYHRPLARLKVVVPDRIYISAMPTRHGLELAQQRHHFRTIINLFPEQTPQRSPLLEDELEFIRAQGIRYLASPSDPSPEASNAFLSQTLAVAQDPAAWPILVHCHGCMDRSPAWMGIYRFVVQGRPLLEIMQEIERHRGYRPKASVTLLYNRVLAPRAGARYWADPTATLLRRCAEGTEDPMRSTRDVPAETANLDAA